jgi:hypothetical protein
LVGDQAAGELEERFVDVGPSFPADPKAPEAMEPGEGSLDHPAVGAESCAVAGDGGHDASVADLVAVGVVVVAAVGEQRVRLATGVADAAAYGRDRVEEW